MGQAPPPSAAATVTGKRRVMASVCWEEHPDGPFATLIEVAATYLNLEATLLIR
jgi:hypothetical protein